MRPTPSALPLLITLLLTGALFLASSCQPIDPVIEELPATATITLDFSDPNSHPGNTDGYRYLFEGNSYSATYNAWTTWSCASGVFNELCLYKNTDITVCPRKNHHGRRPRSLSITPNISSKS